MFADREEDAFDEIDERDVVDELGESKSWFWYVAPVFKRFVCPQYDQSMGFQGEIYNVESSRLT
jgi:hypothetical protein